MIRLSGMRRGFRHGGLVLGDRWTSFNVRELTDEQRATIRDFHGTHVRVHPADVGALAELGLAMRVDADDNLLTREPLIDLRPEPAKAKVDPKKPDASAPENKKTNEPAKAKADARKD